MNNRSWRDFIGRHAPDVAQWFCVVAILAAVLVACAGCTTAPRVEIQRVNVPVPVECQEPVPERPVMPTEGLAQEMADALTKLAIVEERQTQTILAQERAFKALERVEERQRQHELQCRDQEKGLRQLIADSNERLSARVGELEKAEPMQAQTSKWVTAGVWGALALLASFIVPRILERVFQ